MDEVKRKWCPAHNYLVRKWMKPKQSGGGSRALKNRRISGTQESVEERMEAHVLSGAECSCLTEEENKEVLRELGRLKNRW